MVEVYGVVVEDVVFLCWVQEGCGLDVVYGQVDGIGLEYLVGVEYDVIVEVGVYEGVQVVVEGWFGQQLVDGICVCVDVGIEYQYGQCVIEIGLVVVYQVKVQFGMLVQCFFYGVGVVVVGVCVLVVRVEGCVFGYEVGVQGDWYVQFFGQCQQCVVGWVVQCQFGVLCGEFVDDLQMVCGVQLV